MSDLVNYISAEFGEDEGQRVAFAFSRLCLPVPNDGEFTSGYEDGSALVFIDAYGCVLRIEPHQFPKTLEEHGVQAQHFDHPYVLQPIGQFKTEALSIGLYPGLKAGAEPVDAIILKHALARDGVKFWDESQLNIRFLPVYPQYYTKGIPVVIDMGALCCFSSVEPNVDHYADKPPILAGAQKELYGSLYELFAQAWPQIDLSQDDYAEIEGAEMQSVEAFWAGCRDLCEPSSERKESVLFSQWTEAVFPDGANDVARIKYESIRRSHGAYAERMRDTDNPIALQA